MKHNINCWQVLVAATSLQLSIAMAGGLPVDAPLDASSADTDWQYIGVRVGPTCPEPVMVPGTVWTTAQLFRFTSVDPLPPGLARYCVYTASEFNPDVGPNPTPVENLSCAMRAPPCLSRLSKDSLSVNYMGATIQELESIMGPPLRTHLQQQAGRFVAWDTDQRVRLAVIDTEPDGVDQDLDGKPGVSQHGFALLRFARELLCPVTGTCGVELQAGLGLPRVFCDSEPSGVCIDTADGGFVGTQGDLAVAIRSRTRDWVANGSTMRLVINLSVAWDAMFNFDEFGASRVAASAVHSALQDAVCRGALVVAAAGNGQPGPVQAVGPMYPAGWEQEAAPTFAACDALIAETPDMNDFGGPGAYRPLVHAVGAVDTFDRAVTPRSDAQPRLSAYGDHAVTLADFEGTLAPTDVLTGTSVSTAVVSAAAAAAWYYRQDLAAWQVMNLLHDAGNPLRVDGIPAAADFCLASPASCPGARRVQICDAVHRACDDAAADCPAFSCPLRTPVRPEFDIDEIVSRFAAADSFDANLATNEATVAACGAGYVLHWDAGAVPANPCPHRQFHGVQVTPWTDGQPSGVPCEVCGGASHSPGVLYIEIKNAFQGQLHDITLVCGGDPSVDPGPFDAYRIPTPAPLTGGDLFRVDNLPELCETESASVAYTVMGGSATPASALSVVYYATDRDNDDIRDTEDNCILVANDQTDSDGDGIGNRCDPDIAVPNDCMINFLDLVTFRNAIFSIPGDAAWNPDADYNGDLTVNFGDIQIMKEYFLGAPGPSGLANDCS